MKNNSHKEYLPSIEVLITLILGVVIVGLVFSIIESGYFFPSFNEAMGTTSGISNNPAGFWDGVWHGFIAVFTLIASLFSNKIAMYEIHNNGGWYNYGFFLGIAAVVIFSRSKIKIS